MIIEVLLNIISPVFLFMHIWWTSYCKTIISVQLHCVFRNSKKHFVLSPFSSPPLLQFHFQRLISVRTAHLLPAFFCWLTKCSIYLTTETQYSSTSFLTLKSSEPSKRPHNFQPPILASPTNHQKKKKMKKENYSFSVYSRNKFLCE